MKCREGNINQEKRRWIEEEEEEKVKEEKKRRRAERKLMDRYYRENMSNMREN